MAFAACSKRKKAPLCRWLCVPAFFALFFGFAIPAAARYNDYAVNKPSAFRDYNQVMIWDQEIHAALEGLQGTLMFCTGSCFSGGFVDDLTKLDKAVVVTANTWHGFGMSLYDFLPGQTDTRGFHDDYLNAFRNVAQGPPTFQEAFLAARDTVNNTGGNLWSWGGVEHPQFGVSGNTENGTLAYKPGDRAILYSGMWPGNEYFLSSFDNTIAGGRQMLMDDYGWPEDAITTLFYEGQPPPERPIPWNITGAGTKENLLNAMQSAAAGLGPDNTLAVFVIAHGRSSAVMLSRLLADQHSIEYLLIPNGRNIATDGDIYPAADYGSTQVELTGFTDLNAANYQVTLPDSLAGWHWRIDTQKKSLLLEADDPADQDSWLVPGDEYLIRLTYKYALSSPRLGWGGWVIWLPEGGGGPLFQSDYGTPGGGEWGMGEHVPGGPAIGTPDPSAWGQGWAGGGDGWILIPSYFGASGYYSSTSSPCFIGSLE